MLGGWRRNCGPPASASRATSYGASAPRWPPRDRPCRTTRHPRPGCGRASPNARRRPGPLAGNRPASPA